MLVAVELRVQSVLLLVVMEITTGVQGPTGSIAWISHVPAMAAFVLLNALPAAVQRIAGDAHDVEGIDHRNRLREFLACSGLVAGYPVHRDDVDALFSLLRPIGQRLLEHLFRPASTTSSSRDGLVLMRRGGEVDDQVTNSSPLPVWRRTCSATSMTVALSNRAWASIRARFPAAGTALFAVCQAAPRPAGTRLTKRWLTTIPANAHRSPPREIYVFGGAAFPCPAAMFKRIPCTGGGAPARDEWSVATSRFLSAATTDGVSWHALAAAVEEPVFTLDDAALEHPTAAVKVLPDGTQVGLVQAAQGNSIRTDKSSLEHVEVFLMDRIGTQ